MNTGLTSCGQDLLALSLRKTSSLWPHLSWVIMRCRDKWTSILGSEGHSGLGCWPVLSVEAAGPQSSRKQIRVRHFSPALAPTKDPSCTHLSENLYAVTSLCDKWFSDVWTVGEIFKTRSFVMLNPQTELETLFCPHILMSVTKHSHTNTK